MCFSSPPATVYYQVLKSKGKPKRKTAPYTLRQIYYFSQQLAKDLLLLAVTALLCAKSQNSAVLYVDSNETTINCYIHCWDCYSHFQCILSRCLNNLWLLIYTTGDRGTESKNVFFQNTTSAPWTGLNPESEESEALNLYTNTSFFNPVVTSRF